jgi:hypothetical protein
MLSRTLPASCALALSLVLPAALPAQGQTAPVIEEVEPTSGPPGTIVHVTGRRFAKQATVMIAGQALPVVERLPNRISVQIVEGAPSGHITVNGDSGAVRGPEFRVTPAPPAPVVDAIEPAKGTPGTRVVLRGKNFSSRLAANVVTLAGRPVLVRSAAPQALEVVVPEGGTRGTFVVQVGNARAESAPFEVLAATVIESISPSRAAPGGELTIRGHGFSTIPDKNRVFLANVKLPVKTASEKVLVVALPTQLASGQLLVDVDGGGRVAAQGDVLVQLVPKITSFTPRTGKSGTVVTLRGTGFGSETTAIEVKLGDVVLPVRRADKTSLDVEVPAAARTDRFAVRVHGVGPALSEHAFEIKGVPAIASVTPESAAVASEIVIEGEGFSPAVTGNRVRIGGKIAPVLEASPTRLRVRVPDGKGGKVEVHVQGASAALVAPRPFATVLAQ